MRTADFDYALPAELIAQHPRPDRDSSRMLVLRRDSRTIEHSMFARFPEHLRPGDVLVLNNSKVIPARLRGVNAASGGQFEILLVEENGPNDWWAMMRPGKRARPGTRIALKTRSGDPTNIVATVAEFNEEGHRRLLFEGTSNLLQDVEQLGEVPLPPYIQRPDLEPEDKERYQTVFAQPPGSVAAPTAGLHFTAGVLDQIRGMGVSVCFVTLHVGLGTFAPVKTDDLAGHTMHEERYELPAKTVHQIAAAKTRKSKVVAVGTTSFRVLESVALQNQGALMEGKGRTRLFIHPPAEFSIVDALLTNFHLPKSTLLMLVSAFAAPGSTSGRDLVLQGYAEAVRENYRFFSYGDSMLII